MNKFKLKRKLEMKMNNLKNKPCLECPYALGLVHTVSNPCPQCKQNGYSSYEWFQKMRSHGKESKNKDK